MYGIIFVLVLYVVGSVSCNELARGWNENIQWVTLTEAAQLSESQNKPVMLVIHKSWCGACKALKPKLAESKEIEELSTSFVMVNTLDDEEPKDSKYAPDGSYIPRILFLDTKQNVLTNIYNEQGNSDYKYYYSDPETIVTSMNRCLETLQEAGDRAGEL